MMLGGHEHLIKEPFYGSCKCLSQVGAFYQIKYEDFIDGIKSPNNAEDWQSIKLYMKQCYTNWTRSYNAQVLALQ